MEINHEISSILHQIGIDASQVVNNSTEFNRLIGLMNNNDFTISFEKRNRIREWIESWNGSNNQNLSEGGGKRNGINSLQEMALSYSSLRQGTSPIVGPISKQSSGSLTPPNDHSLAVGSNIGNNNHISSNSNNSNNNNSISSPPALVPVFVPGSSYEEPLSQAPDNVHQQYQQQLLLQQAQPQQQVSQPVIYLFFCFFYHINLGISILCPFYNS